MDIVEALRNPLLVTDERFEVAKQAANEIEQLHDLLHQILAYERRKVRENRAPWFDQLCVVLSQEAAP